MSLSDQALEVLGALWDEQDARFLSAYGDLLASWRDYALAHPDEAIAKGLPFAAPLRALIEAGSLSGAADMLSLFAHEAGLGDGGQRAIMHTIADHYGSYLPKLAGDMDGVIGAGARNAALLALQTGMSERDAAGILLEKYGTLGAARARTIARTELTNGATLARIGVGAASGQTRYEYRAVLDRATTRTCTHMEGTVLDLTDPLARQLIPANHYRCRALLVPAASDARPTPAPMLRGHIARRETEFPGWESRLADTAGVMMAGL